MKILGLIFVGVWPLFLILNLFEPIPQNLAYHQFADQNHIFGIPNFHNVLSNLPFFFAALIGYKNTQTMTASWFILILGIFLVGVGSAYYHWDPNNMSLFWDRLPMTIGFMGLTSFIFTEVCQFKWEKTLLAVFLLIGFYSLIHWIYFSDLRVYAWVQLTPILLIIYCAIFYPSQKLQPKFLIGAVIFYILAKAVEHWDHGVFILLGKYYSGHSLKHLLAAVAVFCLLKLNWKKS